MLYTPQANQKTFLGAEATPVAAPATGGILGWITTAYKDITSVITPINNIAVAVESGIAASKTGTTSVSSAPVTPPVASVVQPTVKTASLMPDSLVKYAPYILGLIVIGMVFSSTSGAKAKR